MTQSASVFVSELVPVLELVLSLAWGKLVRWPQWLLTLHSTPLSMYLIYYRVKSSVQGNYMSLGACECEAWQMCNCSSIQIQITLCTIWRWLLDGRHSLDSISTISLINFHANVTKLWLLCHPVMYSITSAHAKGWEVSIHVWTISRLRTALVQCWDWLHNLAYSNISEIEQLTSNYVWDIMYLNYHVH